MEPKSSCFAKIVDKNNFLLLHEREKYHLIPISGAWLPLQSV